MDPKGEENSKIKSFLRRKDNIKLDALEPKQTPSDNTEFIKQKLFEKPKEPLFDFNLREFLTRSYYRLKTGIKFYRQKQFKDNVPMAAFAFFAIYILWKMEAQLDNMRAKVMVKKSIKQMEIERENELIEKALSKNRYEDNVPIQEVEPENRYRYEYDDDGTDSETNEPDDDEGHINTKGDIFRNLEGENKSDLAGVLKEEIDRRKRYENQDYPSYRPSSRYSEDDELFKKF